MLGRGQTFKRWEEAQDICLCENALLVMDKSKEVHDFLQKEGKLLEGLSFKHIFSFAILINDNPIPGPVICVFFFRLFLGRGPWPFSISLA